MTYIHIHVVCVMHTSVVHTYMYQEQQADDLLWNHTYMYHMYFGTCTQNRLMMYDLHTCSSI